MSSSSDFRVFWTPSSADSLVSLVTPSDFSVPPEADVPGVGEVARDVSFLLAGTGLDESLPPSFSLSVLFTTTNPLTEGKEADPSGSSDDSESSLGGGGGTGVLGKDEASVA
jgi:hypothetical protein